MVQAVRASSMRTEGRNILERPRFCLARRLDGKVLTVLTQIAFQFCNLAQSEGRVFQWTHSYLNRWLIAQGQQSATMHFSPPAIPFSPLP
jgi:hypothetical protein